MKTKLLTLLLAGLFQSTGYSQEIPATAADILNKMGAVEKKISNLSISFVQVIEFISISEKQKIESELTYKKPDKIYFRQISPVEQIIVVNNKKVWLYNPAANAVYTGTFGKDWVGIPYFIPAIFTPAGNMSQLTKEYNIMLSSITNTSYILILKPKKQEIKLEFEVWINKTSFLPDKSRFITDIVTCTTEITSVKTNLPVNNDLFNLKIPKSAKKLDFSDINFDKK